VFLTNLGFFRLPSKSLRDPKLSDEDDLDTISFYLNEENSPPFLRPLNLPDETTFLNLLFLF
jgi:hypothetical protein